YMSVSIPALALSSSALYALSLHDALPIFARRFVERRRIGCGCAWSRRYSPTVVRCARRGLGPSGPDRGPPGHPCSRSRGSKPRRSEEHTSELQSPDRLVCRLLLEKKKCAA